MNSIPLPAFQDNDLWALHDGRRHPVRDPGDAQPVFDCLQRDGLQLEPMILVTRGDPDHLGPPMRGPVKPVRECSTPVRERGPERPTQPAAGGAGMRAEQSETFAAGGIL